MTSSILWPQASTRRSTTSRGAMMRRLRQWHRHVGLFFAPVILFFSATGVVQTLEWHELRSGGTPAWLAAAASVHKHQRLPAAAPTTGKPRKDKAKDGANAPVVREHPLLKAFVVLMGLALTFSAIAGAAISLHPRATRRSALMALVGGTILPLLLLGI